MFGRRAMESWSPTAKGGRFFRPRAGCRATERWWDPVPVRNSHAIQPEEELMLLLAGTAERRTTHSARIAELAAAARLDVLQRLMARQWMLPLLGTRMG